MFTLFAMIEQFWWRLGIFDHLLVARDVVVDSLRAAAQAISWGCLAIVIIEAMYVVEVAMRSAGLMVTAVPLMARKSLLDLMSRVFSKRSSKPRKITPAKPKVSSKKLQPSVSAKRPSQMTVAMLRHELTARGLDSTGLKAMLVDRLQDAQDEDDAGVSDPKPTSRKGGRAPGSVMGSSLAHRGVDAIKLAGATILIETAYVSEIAGKSMMMLTTSAWDGILFAVGVVIGLCMRVYHALQFGVAAAWVTVIGLVEQAWWRLGLVDILLVVRDAVVESVFAAGRLVYVYIASIAIEIAYAQRLCYDQSVCWLWDCQHRSSNVSSDSSQSFPYPMTGVSTRTARRLASWPSMPLARGT